jgi:hypothetical protein
MADVTAIMELLLNSKGYKLACLDLFVSDIIGSKLKEWIFMDPRIRRFMKDSASNKILSEVEGADWTVQFPRELQGT